MIEQGPDQRDEEYVSAEIAEACDRLSAKKTKGELGQAIAEILLCYSPRDIQRMKGNFLENITPLNPEYCKSLESSVIGHLQGTFQVARTMHHQGAFSLMQEPVPPDSPAFWKMVAGQCSRVDGGDCLRFLKYLLSGFSMLVQGVPGHPGGMPFPGGDRVDFDGKTWYCPVRTKANEVEAALCPFCPAEQTPEIGYLRPPVKGSQHRKQEFIRNCYDFHNFNG